MFYITIDCGTTNSRAYVVDETGQVFGKATKKVGVKDTAETGSKAMLESGIKQIIREAIEKAGISERDVRAVLSSGMITSEIGLFEIPHLMAPCGVNRLAETITRVETLDIIDASIPVYFVRGIKNYMGDDGIAPFEKVGRLDFMRGEETQMAGLIDLDMLKPDSTAIVLSSHTKLIPVDEEKNILGSLTTLSGQLREAILCQTFVGKSVEKRENQDECPEDYFEPEIVKNAVDWVNEVGLIRSLMFPRFSDVLLKTKWYERSLFFDAMVAAEDMIAVKQLKSLFGIELKHCVLIGREERCRLYKFVLERNIPGISIDCISRDEEIDQLSIKGILSIARAAGVI